MKNVDWPIASVLLGTLGTLAVGVMRWAPRRGGHVDNGTYARATDMAEIRARLVNLEHDHQAMRSELRADLKELRQLIQHLSG